MSVWTIASRWRELLLAGLCLCLPACAEDGNFTLFGYSSAPNYDTTLHTIRVPIFQNKTYARGLEFELTDALVTAIEQNTPYKVVTGDADMEITGTILSYGKQSILQDPLNEPRQYESALVVEIVWKNLRTGQFFTKPRKGPYNPNDPEVVLEPDPPPLPGVPSAPSAPGTLALPSVPTGPVPPGAALGQPATLIDPNAPPGPPPLPGPPVPNARPPKPPVIVVKSVVDWIPELGESYASSRHRACLRLANSITWMMEKPW
jgi:hypothetical protein